MYKRTVYGFVQDRGYFCLSVRGCGSKRKYCPHAEDCKEHVLTDPAELTELEKRAARVPELEQMIAKKDEALTKILLIERKSILADCAYQGPPPKKWAREYAPRYDGYNECLKEVQSITREALLITPDSVTEQTEERLPTVEETAGILRGVKTAYEQRKEDEIYARIGRAVEEWLEEVQGWLAYAVYGNAQPRSLIVELADIIAKAREGKADG